MTTSSDKLGSIKRLESNVRSYCRAFPTVFTEANGALLTDADGRRYIDFFAGAGTMNYGHNEPRLRSVLLEYLTSGGIAHGLDLATSAKVELLETFERVILKPRDLSYRVMFPGPTGTNAVEAAIKLARKVTGRSNVVAFTNAFHGMTLGSLALTGNAGKRGGAGVTLGDVTRMPFDGYLGDGTDTLDYIRTFLKDPSSGIDAPAAFIVETVQGEGGINPASRRWLTGLAEIAKDYGALLIVDDIQMGCGRTGPFFSFETLGITPDIVCLSKSLSGFGLPFSLTLFRPELDAWAPGEHNGTFRGNNLAFVTAAAALDHFWSNDDLELSVRRRGAEVGRRFAAFAETFGGSTRGRGFVHGLSFEDHAVAGQVSKLAFERGLIMETAGSHDEVIKFLAPLTIEGGLLAEGLDILEGALKEALGTRKHKQNGAAAPVGIYS